MSVESLQPLDVADSPQGRERAVVADLAKRVQKDSVWLILGYGITSIVGFAFWIVAARTMTPTEVGIGTAHLGVITAAAAIGATGIGDALLVMLPAAGAQRAALLRLGAVVLAIVAVVAAGVGVAVLALQPGGASPLLVGAIVVSTVAWAFFVIKDAVLQGLGQVRWTLYLNGPANLVKLGMLPILAFALAGSSWALVLSAIVPAAVAGVIAWSLVSPRHARAEEGNDRRVSPELRREFTLFVTRGGIASGVYVSTFLLLPALVTAFAGPEQGAVYALAAQLAATIDLVTHSFGSSFARHASADGRSRTGLVRIWLRTATIAAIAAVGLVAVAPVILWILGDFYVEAGGWAVIALLAATSVINTVVTMWASSLRARRATATLLVWALVNSAVLVAGVWFAAGPYGAMGAATVVLVISALMSTVGIVGLIRASRTREVVSRAEEEDLPA
ncbi:MAG: oligosaccharide flippase family protein [Protaetiibacter sp.]